MIPYHIRLNSALFYSILLYSILLYPTLLYSTLLYPTLLYTTLRYYTLPCYTIPYSTQAYSTILFGVPKPYTYYTRPYHIIPYYILLNPTLRAFWDSHVPPLSSPPPCQGRAGERPGAGGPLPLGSRNFPGFPIRSAVRAQGL